ncbi:MAG: RnfABCDGE type electron transport complex subunit B [Pseudomonadales bacterium]
MAFVLLLALMLSAALLLGWAARRWPPDSAALIDALNDALPQTQCAQCGYPGCRPYAQALVNDGVAETLCPPGGEATATQLRILLGRDTACATVAEPVTLLAVIDEPRCIGCYLCIPACPVDAIIGAPGYMHTVVAKECTGCELCVAPCPVDCISMVSV